MSFRQDTVSSTEVALTLEEEGFVMASLNGVAHDHLSAHPVEGWGMLVPLASVGKARRFPGFVRRAPTPRPFFGRLWLRDPARNVGPRTRWVLEVYGRENILRAQQLSNLLSDRHGVRVEVVLLDMKPYLEGFGGRAGPVW